MKNYKSGIESKRKLYESAKRHFLKDGYQNALIRDIVADAESKLGLFTYYYDSKAAVAGEVCQELFANVKKGIKEILESLSLEQEELLYEMVHYRCWYRCIQSRADVSGCGMNASIWRCLSMPISTGEKSTFGRL